MMPPLETTEDRLDRLETLAECAKAIDAAALVVFDAIQSEMQALRDRVAFLESLLAAPEVDQ